MKILFHLGFMVLLAFAAPCQNQETNIAPESENAPQEITETESSPTNAPLTILTNTPAIAAPTNLPTAWRGVQLFIQSDAAVKALAAALPHLASNGVNAIIVETGYHFDFKTHPELRRGDVITLACAKNLAAVARQYHVRLIPELDCLGHQSAKKFTYAFLTFHPEFIEPSPSNPDPKTDYLKNWCPSDPRINPIIFDLIDEIAAAFDADAFHVGLDEIFNLSSDNCPRCRGQEPAKLFAKVVNQLHAHIVDTNKLEMFMWGDRLLDSRKLGYSKWDASAIGTANAIDLIPTDIVICDWHYSARAAYPSVPLLLQKGFRVWPSGFQPLNASKAFSNYSLKQRALNPRVVGYLCTTWSLGKPETVADWPPVAEILKDWKN